MTETELKTSYETIVTAWQLMKKHHAAKSTDEWRELVSEAEGIATARGPFAKALVLAVCDELERIWKKEN